jgi:N-acetylglucosaminyl-diphospho-decaprenol L-rhamnosyltransferase|tara:strand:- start:1581 stop:2474 length:894 start_codon:yes stop_codon:yes gene_type:complete
MSISRQTLTVVIVTFKSDQVINDCIRSISDQIKIIIVDNSNDKKFKENIEKKYKNVECILSSTNLGMGSGNNLGLKHVKTDYAIILNPDVILEENTIQEIINESKNISSFVILAPLSDDVNYPNYKIEKKDLLSTNINKPFKVKSVDGFAMVLNLTKIRQVESFKNYSYFDENFFMYLENDDLCKRLYNQNENIYIVPQSRIKHLGAKAVNQEHKHEVELSRNWHWIWSKFYYNKKHFGFLVAFSNGFPNFLSAILKFLFFLFFNKVKKRRIYSQRILGFISAVLGKKSFYRPKINN